jgi:hypothetical protein
LKRVKRAIAPSKRFDETALRYANLNMEIILSNHAVRADGTENTTKKRLERRLIRLILDSLAVVLGFFAFQDKHKTIRTLSENIIFICTSFRNR